MSEPSSMYIRIRLTEPAFEAFKAGPREFPCHYDDWRPWLDSKHFYGKITNEEIARMHDPQDTRSCGDYISSLAQYTLVAQSVYTPASQTWTLLLMDASENYRDFLDILSIMRGVARYKDLPGEDFILIYPHFWGGEPNAYLIVTEGASRLVREVPPEVLNEASGMFDMFSLPYRKYELLVW